MPAAAASLAAVSRGTPRCPAAHNPSCCVSSPGACTCRPAVRACAHGSGRGSWRMRGRRAHRTQVRDAALAFGRGEGGVVG
eukprot:411797-Prymnesium_polylepis.1